MTALVIILIGGTIIYFSQFSVQSKKREDINLRAPQKETKTNELNEVFVALGSSLNKANNLSSEKQGDNEEYSFSTGTKIPSIYEFLKKENNTLTAVNLASSGATLNDVLRQQLPKALNLNPKYIALDPGADLVTKKSVTDFKRDLSEIIQKINPQSIIFIFTYPNFVKMRTASYASCQENKLNVDLKNLTADNISVFNQAIKETTADKKNVILLDIYDLLGKEEVSDYDCLHINITGQKKIAEGFMKILNNLTILK